jgi:hypothetical protein
MNIYFSTGWKSKIMMMAGLVSSGISLLGLKYLPSVFSHGLLLVLAQRRVGRACSLVSLPPLRRTSILPD